MAKNCDECGKKLSFRDSFVLADRNVCGACLERLDPSHGDDPEYLLGAWSPTRASEAVRDYTFHIIAGVCSLLIAVAGLVVLIVSVKRTGSASAWPVVVVFVCVGLAFLAYGIRGKVGERRRVGAADSSELPN